MIHTERIRGEVNPELDIHLAIPIGAQDVNRIPKLLQLIDRQQRDANFATHLFVNYRDGQHIDRIEPGSLPPNTELTVTELPRQTEYGHRPNIGYIRRLMLAGLVDTAQPGHQVIQLDADTTDVSDGFVASMSSALKVSGDRTIVSPVLAWDSTGLKERTGHVLDHYTLTLNVYRLLHTQYSYASEGACTMWLSDYIRACGYHVDRRISETYTLSRAGKLRHHVASGTVAYSDPRRLVHAIARGIHPTRAWETSSPLDASEMPIPFDIQDIVREPSQQHTDEIAAEGVLSDDMVFHSMLDDLELNLWFEAKNSRTDQANKYYQTLNDHRGVIERAHPRPTADRWILYERKRLRGN